MHIQVRTDRLTTTQLSKQSRLYILNELIIERLYSAGALQPTGRHVHCAAAAAFNAKKWCVFGKMFLCYPQTISFRFSPFARLFIPIICYFLTFWNVVTVWKLGLKIHGDVSNLWAMFDIFGDSRPIRVHMPTILGHSSPFATDYHTAKNLQDTISGSWEKSPALKEK